MKVRAGGVDDPDAARAGDVLGGYFEMERARDSRRLVLRVVAVSGLVMWALEVATSVLTRVDVIFGAVLLAGAAAASAVLDWRARKRLRLGTLLNGGS
jgi:hypothetical protein